VKIDSLMDYLALSIGPTLVIMWRCKKVGYLAITDISTSLSSAVLKDTLHQYNSLLSFIAHGIVPLEMKNYYIYAKCLSKLLINEPN
jgi:translation elongation factor EF-4